MEEKKNKSLLKILLGVLIVLISFLAVLLGLDPSGDLRVNNLDNLDGVIFEAIAGDKYYSETKVNLLKEDQWLCTIEEAEAKNFERALQ